MADVTKSVTVGEDASVRVDIDLGLPIETTIERPPTPQRREMEEQRLRLGRAVVGGVAADQQNAASPGAFAPSLMSANAAGGGVAGARDPEFNTEEYAGFDENPFLAAKANPLSTFSIDVDRASYANVRRFLREGQLPPKDAVRIEELVNYFTYDDAAPKGGETPFTVTTELAPAPWRPEHHLLRIALKARSIDTRAVPPSNLVFLMDVSGSMNSPDKLPLLKQAFGLLVNELRDEDRVAIVVYAGAAGVVLESTPGGEKEAILAAIERLEAGGSTAGGAGIRLAYDIARRNHIRGGNNRVILATDGDFNIGASSDAEMMRLIEEKRRQGTFLTVLGFGTGNLKDSKMEVIADRGNGNYAYIDGLMEARKVLIEELGGTLFAIAKDVKLQVEFNHDAVKGYRLIGYENRLLAAEDFNDDRKDAGELGAGHSVTALYEVVPADAESDVDIRGIDPLRYQTPSANSERGARGELAFVKLRWKQPDGDRSALLEHPVTTRTTEPTLDFRFAAAVASFGMLLRESEHAGNATFERVTAWAKDGIGSDRGGHRAGFVELVELARRIDGAVADAIRR
jgi:Ca-activated chloride channel family protein